MPTRMKHPEHGFWNASDNNEMNYMKARGWTEDVPEAPKAPVVETVLTTTADVAPVKNKGGRPKKS